MMIKQREILLTQRFFPEFGGSIRLLFELFRLWEKPVAVICHDYQGDNEQVAVFTEKKAPALEYLRADVLQDNWGYDSWRNILKAVRLAFVGYFSAETAKRVFCARLVPEALPGLITARLPWRRRSLIAFVHGEEILACESSRQLKLLLSFVAKRVDLVVANSEHTASLLDGYVASSRIEVITPGVATEEFSPKSEEDRIGLRNEFGLSAEAFVILTVGRIDTRKNQIATLKAVEELSSTYPQIEYLVAGEGPERKSLEREVEARGLSKSVKILGSVSDAERVALFQLADLFVMPSIASKSDTEGFGMVFLEAAACGLASIAGNVGGQAEAVIDGTTGMVVDGNNLAALSSAIAKCVAEPEILSEMSQAAIVHAESQDWVVKREKLSAVLESRGL